MRTQSIVVSFLTLLFLASSLVLAMAGTDPIKGPVSADESKRLAWPDGSLALVNDPSRIHGERPWFSELPNAGRYFEYEVKSMDDVNRLAALLGAIQAPKVVLEISPLANAGTPDALKRRTVGAQLAMHSQSELNQWFDHLTAEGRKKFRTAERPLAGPPTLTIYARHSKVALAKLVLPANVMLESAVSVRDRQDATKDLEMAKWVGQVEKFVKEQEAKQPATRPAAAPPR